MTEPQLHTRITDHFGKVLTVCSDGRWHTVAEIARETGLDHLQVRSALSFIKRTRAQVERRPHQAGQRPPFEFRVCRSAKMVSAHVLVEKLAPIVRALRDEGRKNTIAPAQVSYFAARIQRLLDEWTEPESNGNE
jgi:hypothetical protein